MVNRPDDKSKTKKCMRKRDIDRDRETRRDRE